MTITTSEAERIEANQKILQSIDLDIEYLNWRPEPKYREALDTLLKLREAGFEVLYGGRKGNGFWIRGLKTPRGTYFFTVKEAVKLLKETKTA
jgi:hypothetical protein